MKGQSPPRKKPRPLFSARQLRFIEEYVKDFNATQAAIRAGYSKKTAYSQGQRLLKHVELAAEIEKRKTKISEQCEVTSERIIKEYAAMAFVDPAEFYHPNGKVRTLRQMPEQTRRALTSITKHEKGYKLATEKKGALDSLSRIHGMFHDKIEHTGLENLGEQIAAARTRAQAKSPRIKKA